MAKLRTYTMAWGMPTDADVVNVRIRGTVPPIVPDYTTPYDEVGVVSQVNLPLPKTPLIDGDISIAVSTVDDVGNESDLSVITFPFDLVAPSPVTGLQIL
jgi:hypothetical protein